MFRNFFRLHYKKLIYLICAVSIIAIAIPLYFYRQTFSGEISTNSENWSHFGDFFNGTAGIVILTANLALIAIIHIHSNQEQHHKWVTQFRIPEFHKVREKLTVGTFQEQLQFLEDYDLNHSFFFDRNQLRILETLQLRLIQELQRVNEIPEFLLSFRDRLSEEEQSALDNLTILTDDLLSFLFEVLRDQYDRNREVRNRFSQYLTT